jgi:predicted enzyme related to lactoylglutathione lyase
MPATLRYFAINADDEDRAKAFYAALFGWRFAAWGPPGFSIIETPGGPMGAVMERSELIEGRTTRGFVCTLGVEDIRAAMAAAEAGGGRIVEIPHLLEGVAQIGYVEDPEGNVFGLGQYLNPERAWPPGAPTHGRVRHFAINAAETGRARAFYEAVCGWTLTPSGAPGSYQTRDVGAGRLGALQSARELIAGCALGAFELTVQVDDIGAALDQAAVGGGRVLGGPFRIDGIGDIGFIEDTEGNACGVGQYLPGAWS